ERRSGLLAFVEKRTDSATGFYALIPEPVSNNLNAYIDRAVVLGCRPEDISISHNGICAQVEVIEPMGAETYLYLNTGAHSLIARVPPHERPAIGQRLNIVFDMRKCCFFDAATEQTIDCRHGSV